jgi:putative FmdB family regulatory protein
MALYEFKCTICDETIEVIQKFNDEPPEHCGEPMERVLAGGNVGIELKGDCWAKDGYTKKKKK